MMFSSAGRIGPMRWAGVTAAASVAWWLAALAFDRGGLVTYVLVGAASGAVLAWLAAETVRRLHDTGRSGGFGLLGVVVLAVPLLAITPTSLAWQPRWVFPSLAGLAALVAAVMLLRPGERAINRYGALPTGPFAWGGAVAGPRRAMLWAGVSMVGCALIALAIINISNGMRDRHEHDARTEQQGRLK